MKFIYKYYQYKKKRRNFAKERKFKNYGKAHCCNIF